MTSVEAKGAHVIRAQDRTAESDVFFRRALQPTRSEADALRNQFQLHRSLSESGTVDAYDLILSQGVLTGFTMPLLAGSPLSNSIARLTQRNLFEALRDVAFATYCLHSLGYFHGDLTANNVWIPVADDSHGGVLLDLGFAARIGTRLSTEVRGTPGHIPPEMKLGTALGPAADAYSFGKMLDSLLEYVADSSARAQLKLLVQRCTSEIQENRLSDFSLVYEALMRIARDHINPRFMHSKYLLPLRVTGLQSRLRTLGNRLATPKTGGVMWVVGEPGSGKSELIRHICNEAQVRGLSTIRFTDVTSIHECVRALDKLLSASDYAGDREGLVVSIDTLPGCYIDRQAAELIEEIARDSRIVILTESRETHVGSATRVAEIVKCRTFTFRECMYASGHLVANRGIIVQNTEAVIALTAGLPRDVRSAMTDHFLSGRRGRGEPVDFSPASTRSALVNASGLMTGCRRTRDDDEHPVTTALGSSAVRSRLLGNRSAAANILRELRVGRRLGKPDEVSLCRRLSDLYEELGSIRRRSRWLQAGIRAYKYSTVATQNERVLNDYIAMLGKALPPLEAVDRFKSLFDDNYVLSPKLRCIVSGEMGAAYLFAMRPTEAQAVLHECLALCKTKGGLKEYEPLTLNRLGTAKMLLQDYAGARQYFSRASSSAKKFNDHATLSRVDGNRGFLALEVADPADALRWLRRHSNSVLGAHRYPEYLANLLNQTRGLVDLGKGLAAERRSRLAVALAESLADDMRLAYARNNLGWVMSMRCNGKLAMQCFRQALAIRETIGDCEGVAQTSLNIARLHLTARSYDLSLEFIDRAGKHFEKVGNHEGLLDIKRLIVKRSLLLADYDLAESTLALILRNASRLPPKDYADTLLLKLEMHLWSGNTNVGTETLRDLDKTPTASNVQPIQLRRNILAGFLSLQAGDPDSAHKQISAAASMLRDSHRQDLILEAVTIMAVVAQRMNNTAIALRYLQFVKESTEQLKRDIQ